MLDPIIESEMSFRADNTFHIEQSQTYRRMSGIKSVEFVRRKDSSLLFVEAKISFPNLETDDKTKIQRYEAEIRAVKDKFIHSLNLFASIALGVNDDDITATGNKGSKKTDVTFVFVIRNHRTKWCRPIRDMLIDEFPPYLLKIWKPVVLVINHEAAVKKEIAMSTSTPICMMLR